MVKALNKAAEKSPPLDLNKKTCEDINERLPGPMEGVTNFVYRRTYHRFIIPWINILLRLFLPSRRKT